MVLESSSASSPDRKVVVTQPNYLPWRGHFALLSEADVIVFLDDVQFTKRDWRNRNIIVSREGTQWLSIPVESKGRFKQTIRETRINDPEWKKRHWRTLKFTYERCAGWTSFADLFGEYYSAPTSPFLVDELLMSLDLCCRALGIRTQVQLGSELPGSVDPTRRLIEKVSAVDGSRYLSGPSARRYLDEVQFKRSGIEVCWYEYPQFRPYRQLQEGFTEHVSIADLLCCRALSNWMEWDR